MVKCGVDRLNSYKHFFSGGRVGLLTSITGRNQKNESTIQVLTKICKLTVLFGPEHGVRGDLGAGDEVENTTDPATGLPVYSLYGGAGKHFSSQHLETFDILVYDIQDIGVRYYTFLSTLRNALEDCGRAGKKLVILDRPNPLGGDIVEGGILNMDYNSFVGCYPLPSRYGLTSGEAARLMNEEGNYGCELEVVPCDGWKRNSLFSDWGTVWLPPSLGLPSFETVLLYPGTCLIEGTNFSEGRGTTAPFRMIGAPFADAEELAAEFNRAGLEGVVATPSWFNPTASKHMGVQCAGILLHVTEPHKLRPVSVGVTLLDILRCRYPGQFAFLPPSKEGGRPFITLLSGSDVLLGDWDKETLLENYRQDSTEFMKRKERFHLYD